MFSWLRGGQSAAPKGDSLRVGQYTITEKNGNNTTSGSPRPFVYVPEGFDLTARGAIGQVLEALGVNGTGGAACPSVRKLYSNPFDGVDELRHFSRDLPTHGCFAHRSLFAAMFRGKA